MGAPVFSPISSCLIRHC